MFVPRALATAAALLLLLLAAGAADAIADGKFADGTLVETDVCFSASGNGRQATMRLPYQPASNEILVRDLPDAPKVTISCMHVVETGPATTAGHCDGVKSELYICSAPVKSEVFTCDRLVEYIYANRVVVNRGSLNGPMRRWRLEWGSGGKPTICFPRIVEMVAVVSVEQQLTGSPWVFGILITIVALFVLCMLLFGLHQFRTYAKRRAYFEAQGKAPVLVMSPSGGGDGAQTMSSPAGAEADPGRMPPQPLPIAEARDLYLASVQGRDQFIDMDGSVLQRYTTHDATAEHIAAVEQEEARALQRPAPSLYQRSFLQPLDAAAVDTSVAVYSPRGRGGGGLPGVTDTPTVVPAGTLEHTRRSARRYIAALAGVVVCADCDRPVQDAATPQFCARSGKRHY
jgi:hypothetical protein